jgi:predicted alpha/beta-fold hydrolase
MATSLLFRPLPFLTNPHVQTLLGHVLNGRLPSLRARRRLLALPDGDRLVLHDSTPPAWQPGQPVALLVHGLCGSHRSGTVVRVAALLLRQGMRVVRLDLRGAGLGLGLARKTYTGACSQDVRAAAEEVGRWCPRSPLYLAGFSLGGNLVLKAAGEAAAEPLANLAGVAAVAPPIDMERCADLLATRRNRLYERYFVRNLVRFVAWQQGHYPDSPRTQFPRRTTLRQFDDLYTAPLWGFRDAADYYRQASSLPLVSRIEVPALLLTARDDPFIAVQPFEELPAAAHREVEIAENGGHLGFLGWDGSGGIRWAEHRVAEWLLERSRFV